MTENELKNYLYEAIPLTKAMQISVECASKEIVILQAPLLPNVNHKKTAFGGSLNAIATLSCWSLLHLNLVEHYPHVQIVISHNETKYLNPVIGLFLSECIKCDEAKWKKFSNALHSKGKARIELSATIYQKAQKKCVDFKGTFVALVQKISQT